MVKLIADNGIMIVISAVFILYIIRILNKQEKMLNQLFEKILNPDVSKEHVEMMDMLERILTLTTNLMAKISLEMDIKLQTAEAYDDMSHFHTMLREVVREMKNNCNVNMTMHKTGERLVRKGYITLEQLDEVLAEKNKEEEEMYRL